MKFCIEKKIARAKNCAIFEYIQKKEWEVQFSWGFFQETDSLWKLKEKKESFFQNVYRIRKVGKAF